MIQQAILNNYLERTHIYNEIYNILQNFEKTSQQDRLSKKNVHKNGIYIYGTPGTGKTKFVLDILKTLNYDTITYDAGCVRNKALFSNIDNDHISNYNVLDLLKRKKRKIAIFMDEIDGMNNGDKGGLDALIKLIREKKTKKQKTENTTMNPIICVGNNENDKKIRELMHVCHVFELKTPTELQLHTILIEHLQKYTTFEVDFQIQIQQYIQGDLRKLFFLQNLSIHKPEMIKEDTLGNIFHVKILNEDAKTSTLKLLKSPISIDNHNIFMNETDRTTISLLWHENIPRLIEKEPGHVKFPFYKNLLNNICFADYIGRITFQSQIWQFNEMTSLIKTFYNNKLFHDQFKNHPSIELKDIEFTKVLTKYSTEYNNQNFLQSLCQRMNMDKRDVLCFFQELRIIFGDNYYTRLENYPALGFYFQKDFINVLDIKRIYRFLDKNMKKDDFISEIDTEEPYLDNNLESN
jgi:hypothetical protein